MADEVFSKELVGERLRVLREALDLSAAELCRRAGIEQNTYNNSETGDNRISVPNAVRIARVTGVSLDFIYQGIRETLPAKILHHLGKLDRAAQSAERKQRKRRA